MNRSEIDDDKSPDCNSNLSSSEDDTESLDYYCMMPSSDDDGNESVSLSFTKCSKRSLKVLTKSHETRGKINDLTPPPRKDNVEEQAPPPTSSETQTKPFKTINVRDQQLFLPKTGDAAIKNLTTTDKIQATQSVCYDSEWSNDSNSTIKSVYSVHDDNKEKNKTQSIVKTISINEPKKTQANVFKSPFTTVIDELPDGYNSDCSNDSYPTIASVYSVHDTNQSDGNLPAKNSTILTSGELKKTVSHFLPQKCHNTPLKLLKPFQAANVNPKTQMGPKSFKLFLPNNQEIQVKDLTSLTQKQPIEPNACKQTRPIISNVDDHYDSDNSRDSHTTLESVFSVHDDFSEMDNQAARSLKISKPISDTSGSNKVSRISFKDVLRVSSLQPPTQTMDLKIINLPKTNETFTRTLSGETVNQQPQLSNAFTQKSLSSSTVTNQCDTLVQSLNAPKFKQCKVVKLITNVTPSLDKNNQQLIMFSTRTSEVNQKENKGPQPSPSKVQPTDVWPEIKIIKLNMKQNKEKRFEVLQCAEGEDVLHQVDQIFSDISKSSIDSRSVDGNVINVNQKNCVPEEDPLAADPFEMIFDDSSINEPTNDECVVLSSPMQPSSDTNNGSNDNDCILVNPSPIPSNSHKNELIGESIVQNLDAIKPSLFKKPIGTPITAKIVSFLNKNNPTPTSPANVDDECVFVSDNGGFATSTPSKNKIRVENKLKQHIIISCEPNLTSKDDQVVDKSQSTNIDVDVQCSPTTQPNQPNQIAIDLEPLQPVEKSFTETNLDKVNLENQEACIEAPTTIADSSIKDVCSKVIVKAVNAQKNDSNSDNQWIRIELINSKNSTAMTISTSQMRQKLLNAKEVLILRSTANATLRRISDEYLIFCVFGSKNSEIAHAIKNNQPITNDILKKYPNVQRIKLTVPKDMNLVDFIKSIKGSGIVPQRNVLSSKNSALKNSPATKLQPIFDSIENIDEIENISEDRLQLTDAMLQENFETQPLTVNSFVKIHDKTNGFLRKCAVCFSTLSNDEITSALTGPINRLIKEHLGVEFTWQPMETLNPDRICTSCSKILEYFDEFKKQSVNKHQVFQEYLKFAEMVEMTGKDYVPFDDEQNDVEYFGNKTSKDCVKKRARKRKKTNVDKIQEPPQKKRSTGKNLQEVSNLCDICGAQISPNSVNHLKVHLSHHTSAYQQHLQRFTCKLCHLNVANSRILARHMMRHELEPPGTQYKYACINHCEAIFKDQKDLYTHMTSILRRKSGNRINIMIYKQDNVYVCPTCHIKYKKAVAFRSHLFRHRTDEATAVYKYTCDHCDLLFKSEMDLCAHKTLVEKPSKPSNVLDYYDSNKNKFICNKCNYSTCSSSILQHVQEHSSQTDAPYTFECEKCHQRFQTDLDLTEHSSTCPELAPSNQSIQMSPGSAIECAVCLHLLDGWAFRYDYDVNKEKYRHFLDHYWNQSIRMLRCHVCRYTQHKGQPKKMWQHMQVHQKEDYNNFRYQWHCDGCDRLFAVPRLLSRHLLICGNLRSDLECPTCHEHFRNRNLLEQHQNQHRCSRINKFWDKILRRYICLTCRLKSRNPSRFLEHLRYHENEAPDVVYSFQCDICELLFTNANAMNIHKSDKHFDVESYYDAQSEMYNCNVCDKKIRKKTSFRVHIINHNTISAKLHTICEKKSLKSNRSFHLDFKYGN